MLELITHFGSKAMEFLCQNDFFSNLSNLDILKKKKKIVQSNKNRILHFPLIQGNSENYPLKKYFWSVHSQSLNLIYPHTSS